MLEHNDISQCLRGSSLTSFAALLLTIKNYNFVFKLILGLLCAVLTACTTITVTVIDRRWLTLIALHVVLLLTRIGVGWHSPLCVPCAMFGNGYNRRVIFVTGQNQLVRFAFTSFVASVYMVFTEVISWHTGIPDTDETLLIQSVMFCLTVCGFAGLTNVKWAWTTELSHPVCCMVDCEAVVDAGCTADPWAGIVTGCGWNVDPGAGVVIGCGWNVDPGAGVVIGCGWNVDPGASVVAACVWNADHGVGVGTDCDCKADHGTDVVTCCGCCVDHGVGVVTGRVCNVDHRIGAVTNWICNVDHGVGVVTGWVCNVDHGIGAVTDWGCAIGYDTGVDAGCTVALSVVGTWMRGDRWPVDCTSMGTVSLSWKCSKRIGLMLFRSNSLSLPMNSLHSSSSSCTILPSWASFAGYTICTFEREYRFLSTLYRGQRRPLASWILLGKS